MADGLVSVTDLCAYSFCQRSLYLKLVFKLREPVKPVMLLGSLRHSIYDEATKKEEELVRQITAGMDLGEIASLFAKAYNILLNKSVYAYSAQLQTLGFDKNKVAEDLRPAVTAQAMKRADEIAQFALQNKLFGEALWEQLTPKFLSELSVRSTALRLKGIVDRIEVRGAQYIPVELKTGRAPAQGGVWPTHRLQVAAYILLLNEKLNASISEGVVHYVTENKPRRIFMNPFMVHEVKTAVDNVFELKERKDIPLVCGKGYCTVCSLGDDYAQYLLPEKEREEQKIRGSS